MKIIIAFSAITLFLPAISFAAVTDNLHFGSRGNQVTDLQRFLQQEALFHGPITGYFFRLTLNAVKQYQVQVGIAATGFVGPLTRSK